MIRIVYLVLLMGCGDFTSPIFNPNHNEGELSTITFVLENEVDSNGYLHLVHNRNSFQSFHRITGYVYRDDEPMNVLKFGWWCDYYWEYDGFVIPIVNGSSYSGYDGEVNTMVGLVPQMIGDTITIYYGWYDDWKSEEVYGGINVVID